MWSREDEVVEYDAEGPDDDDDPGSDPDLSGEVMSGTTPQPELVAAVLSMAAVTLAV